MVQRLTKHDVYSTQDYSPSVAKAVPFPDTPLLHSTVVCEVTIPLVTFTCNDTIISTSEAV
jgi:hypothetical protein